jgi:hypothetical protein
MNPGTIIEIEALLRDVAAEDREGDYVAPREEKRRAQALGRLIAQAVGARFAPFTFSERPPMATWLKEYFTADPVQFVPAALSSISKMLQELEAKKAQRIDVAFIRCQDNSQYVFGDCCMLAISYSIASDSSASVEPVSVEQKKRRFTGERPGWPQG